MRRILATLVIVGLLSGCLSSQEDAAPATAGPGQSSNPIPSPPTMPIGDNHTVVNTTEEVVNWTSFQFKGEGTANSWLFVYQPLPAPIQSVQWHYMFQLTLRIPAGSPGGAVFTLPGPTTDFGQGPQLNESWILTRYDPDGGDLLIRHDTQAAPEQANVTNKPGAKLTGFFFSLVTNGEWTLDVALQLGNKFMPNAEPPVEPQFIARGGNVTFVAPGTDGPGQVPVLSHHMTLSQTLSDPGWNHLFLAPHNADNILLETADIRFPGGYSYQQTNEQSRYVSFGVVNDAAGEFSATVETLHGYYDLAFFHAPLQPSDYPPKFHSVNYRLEPWAPKPPQPPSDGTCC